MQLLINALRRSLLLLMLCFAVSVSAQLSLKSDTGKVCAGSAFLLTSSGGNGQILRYEKSYDGSKWMLLKKTAEVMAADNMSETYSTVYYRVTSEDGSIQSPAIAISQLTDNSCSKVVIRPQLEISSKVLILTHYRERAPKQPPFPTVWSAILMITAFISMRAM